MARCPSASAAAEPPRVYGMCTTSSSPGPYPAAAVRTRVPFGSRTATWVSRCATTSPTPGVRATVSRTCPVNGWKLVFWTMKSAPSVLSICRSNDADIEVLATDIPPTRASPTISAAAVAPVRRGLRRALRWLIRPTAPNRAGKAPPSTRITGRTSSGPATTVAISVSATPTPSSAAACPVLVAAAHPASPAAPTAPITPPTTARTFNGLPTPATSASVSAAIGETAAARRAGR